MIETNKEFISRVMSAIHATPIEKPKAKSELKKIYLHEKLTEIEFNKLLNLLENSISKINIGKTEDGLTDLRSSLEIFLVEMVKKIGEKPASPSRVKDNIKLLHKHGYINDRIFIILEDIYYKWIYRHLSDKPVHKREVINIIDAEFLFHLVEEFMDYLINKIVYGL